MDRARQSAARQLAEAHYELDPGLDRIVQLLSTPEREADPAEPIKLLEVNADTTASGIHPLFFGAHPSQGVRYPSVIIEVTPEEFEQIQRNPTLLPNAWRLGPEIAKPAPAGRA